MHRFLLFWIVLLTILGGTVIAKAWTGPSGLTVSSRTTTSMTVQWSPYSPLPQGKTSVRRYRVQYKLSSDTTYTSSDTTATSLTLTSLLPGRNYSVRVRAYFNPDGATSDWSPIIVASTLAAEPTPTPTPTPTPEPTTCNKYAATTGSDSNTGTASAPLRTPQKLASSLIAGQVGCFNAGTYTDGGAVYVVRITADDITLRSTPGQKATLRGTTYVVNGADRVTLSDLILDGRRSNNTPTPSPQVMATDTVLERNEITNPTDICAIAGNLSGYGRAIRPIFRNNTFHDCGSDTQLDHGIYLDATTNAKVLNNTFLRSAAYAVHMYPDAQGTLVADNRIDDNGGGVIFAGQGSLASSNNIVERNVIVNSHHKPGIESYWGGTVVGTGNIARNNCFDNNPAGDIVGGGFTSSGNTFGPC